MLQLLAQTYTYTTTTTSSSSGELPGFFWLFILLSVVLGVISIVAMWKIFEKAGRPGWAAIVPIYNSWVLFEIVGFPGWLVLLAFVPFVNIAVVVAMFIAYFKLAKLFGKSDMFAALTIFFPYIMFCILGFGDAQIAGAQDAGAPQAPTAPTPPTTPTPPAAV